MIKTLLADHGELSLIGLRAILQEVPRIEIVGVAADAITMQAMLVRHKPDVVLIDHTSEGFGPQTIREGLRRSKRTRFISITPEPSPGSIVSAIKAGVTSYIRKDCTAGEIIDSVLQTADGDKFFCGKVLNTLKRASVDVDRFLAEPLTCAPVTLSPREMQIITMISEGMSYTRIAEQLDISAHTVSTHRRNIMQKLGVNNTAAVVMYAVKNGMISPNRFLFDQN
jgi:DNA-binding NarL/FixJ family response regulator